MVNIGEAKNIKKAYFIIVDKCCNDKVKGVITMKVRFKFINDKKKAVVYKLMSTMNYMLIFLPTKMKMAISLDMYRTYSHTEQNQKIKNIDTALKIW